MSMEQLLTGKNAIIYGAGGSLGGGVARTFAREGANLFLLGRRRQPLEAVAADVTAAGGTAHVATFDALDEAAVEAHVAEVGRVDVSFDLITRGDVQGVPFLDIATDDLVRPVVNGLTTTFITARAAARRMVEQGSGVILHLTSASSAGTAPAMGGTGPADAAIETLMRYLAAELGPRGVRVLGVWTAGVSGTLTDEKIAEVAGPDGPTAAEAEAMLAGMAALGRTPTVDQVAEVAAFLASDRSAGMTSSIANVTCGLVLR
jgi:NAD(P)-dependent dehydrogenase (short-subunit alcohol dehydrogenase family)